MDLTDVGCHHHQIAISKNGIVKEFRIPHNKNGFDQLLTELRKQHGAILIGMEGNNGYARPLDQILLNLKYHVVNINNLKLARYKEVFQTPAKTDRLDALAIVSLLEAAPILSRNKKLPFQDIFPAPLENQQLKRLSRRRKQLVGEKVRISNRIQVDLQSVCPGFMDIVERIDKLFVLRFLSSRNNLQQLSKMREESILKIHGIGKSRLKILKKWQDHAVWGPEIDWVGPMIIEDAKRLLELIRQIDLIGEQLKSIVSLSAIGRAISSVPGFGSICASEIAGEIGTIERFASERSLAMYLGMAPLDNSSGLQQGTKAPLQINKRARAAMMVAISHHKRTVEKSTIYYDKKRAEGKRHNQALRSLGRHLVRILWKNIQKEYQLLSSTTSKTA